MPGSWIFYSNKQIRVDGKVLEVQVNGRNENLRHTIRAVVWGPDDEHLFDVVTRAPTYVDPSTGRSRSGAGQRALQERLHQAEDEATRRAQAGEWQREATYELLPAEVVGPANHS
jgi:hypothetical protein